MSGSVKKTSRKTEGETKIGTPTSQPQSQEETSSVTSTCCLDASLCMLHNSMERATAYEYLLHHGKDKNRRSSEGSGNSNNSYSNGESHGIGSPQKPMRSVASLVQAAEGLGHFPFDPTAASLQGSDEPRVSMSSSSSPPPAATTADQTAHASWWLKVLHRQEKQHERDRKQWQQHLHEAQNHSSSYKNESKNNLTDSLQSRLQLLEKERLHPSRSNIKKTASNGDDSVPSVSRTSTGTTHSTGSGTAVSSVAGQEEASTAGLEVSYDSSLAVRKLGDLELTYDETVRQHATERDEWVEKLDRAAAVTADGQKLSESMQSQLMDLAEEIQNGNIKQRRQWKERVKALEQLVELTEQQHKVEKTEWQEEKDVLETTVTRLASDVQQQATELQDGAYENGLLENTVAQLVADKDSLQRDQASEFSEHYQTEKRQWQNENGRLTADLEKRSAELKDKLHEMSALNNSVAQLVADKASLRAECSKLQEKLRSTAPSGSPGNLPKIVRTGSPSVPSPRRLEWDDKLDRAMVERDVYWQEAEKNKSLLVEVERQHAREREEWVRQKDKKDNDLYADTSRRCAQQATRIEKLEQEVDTSSDEIHKRYQQSVEKRNELGSRIQSIEKHHSSEKHSWKLRLEAALLESRTSQDKRRAVERELELLKSKHAETIEEWRNRLQAFQSEAEDELEQLRNQNATEIERELEIYRDTSSIGLTEDFKDHQRAVCKAVEELRLDVMSIRETLDVTAKTESILETSRHSEVRLDLEQIQESLNDAVAEITLETEAMLESRTAVKSLAVDLAKSFPSKEDQTRSLEFQEKVADELIDVRNQLSKLIELDSSRLAAVQEACHLQFESQLQMKEMALEACNARLNETKEELRAERSRKKAKRRAGPSSNRHMSFQATNDDLEVTLNEAGMDHLGGTPSYMYSDDASSEDSIICAITDETSPMLEEALALAQGLTDIVHGRGDYNKETSVMEMLESLSEMMDLADRKKGRSDDRGDLGSEAAAETSTSPPMGHFSSHQEEVLEVSDSPPAPVTTPMQIRSSAPGSLQMVVEQLYQRCQLLESERTDLMEVTLDLLESARESNAVELDAALATFRQNSSQELMKVNERNQSNMARLYTRLCGSCKHGLVLMGTTKEEG